MTNDNKAMINKWAWKYLGFKRRQFHLPVEVHKKSRAGIWAFWVGIAIGYMPYIIHKTGVLV